MEQNSRGASSSTGARLPLAAVHLAVPHNLAFHRQLRVNMQNVCRQQQQEGEEQMRGRVLQGSREAGGQATAGFVVPPGRLLQAAAHAPGLPPR